MGTALQSKVLVLNRSWTPVNIVTALEAVCKVYADKARIVDKEYRLFDFDGWVDNWRDARAVAAFAADRQIQCVNFTLPIPEVIVLNHYNGYRQKRARLSRAAILSRDGHVCQYCGRAFPVKRLNIDHVLPRSRGGGASWTNLVLSCLPCNTRKANRLPSEAGMKLIRTPFEPHWTQVARKRMRDAEMPESWEDFLGKLYWNVTLEE